MYSRLIGIAFFLVTLTATAAASPNRIAGTYTARAGDEVVVLVLSPDGTGRLGEETGRWRASSGKIRLADSEGNEVVGSVKDGVLEFRLEGSLLRFTRAKPFSPKLLPGKTVKPEDGDGSFRVPKKWRHAWGKGLDGNVAYTMSSADNSVAIAVGRTQLSKKESSSATEVLLLAGLADLLSDVDYSREVEPESFLVGGRRGGRVVIRATVDGESIEGYLGAVVTRDWAYTVHALYRAKDHKLGRAAADTVLATLRVRPPKPAPKASAAASIAGCWKRSSATGGGGGKVVLRLYRAGTFTRFESSIIVGGGTSMSSQDTTDGKWSTTGNTLTLSPKGARRTNSKFGLRAGNLVLDGKTYYRCT